MSAPAPVATLVELIAFAGAAGNRLVGDAFGSRDARPVLLLHGGGQTRHAWRRTATELAGAGWRAYCLDQRGHGDSAWLADGRYTFRDFGADAAAAARALTAMHGQAPAVIGASLGGIAALLADGAADDTLFAALVLVDVTPRMDPQGVEKIQGFMRAHAAEGFATVAEAADAVAAYLPHRPRPRSLEGLRKNLRQHGDGRWRWHWDPQFVSGPHSVNTDRDAIEAELIAAARKLTAPTLLVRGASSELVSEDLAREFLTLAPHADYVDVAGARHMVAGDRNDQFTAAVTTFLARLPSR